MRLAVISSARLLAPIFGGQFTSLKAGDHIGNLDELQTKLEQARRAAQKALTRYRNAKQAVAQEQERIKQLEAQGDIRFLTNTF